MNVLTQGVLDECSYTGAPRWMFLHRGSEINVLTQGLLDECPYTEAPTLMKLHRGY